MATESTKRSTMADDTEATIAHANDLLGEARKLTAG
jgi:hypothetical protein